MAVLKSSLVVSLVDKVTGPARRLNATVDKLRNAQRANQMQMARARGQMLDAVGGFYLLKQAIGGPVQASQDLESALTDLADKGNLSRTEVGRFGKMAKDLSPKVNQFATEIVRGADYLVGMGLSSKQAAGAMPAISKAATATRASIEDLSKASYAAMQNLKVPADQVTAALDAMAYAGKQGGFELKDMASDFPTMTASMQAFGSKGVSAVADLAAALQIVRQGAGSGAEAATNLNNILQKISAPATVRKFKQFGIDIRAELKKALAAGESPIQMIAEQTNTALGGDLTKLGDLFEDAQVQKGLRPLIQQLEQYKKLREETLGQSGGTIDQSFARQTETNREKFKSFSIQTNNLATALGTALIPALNRLSEALKPITAAITWLTEQHPKLTAAVFGTAAAFVALKVAKTGLTFVGLLGKGGLIQAALWMTSLAAGMVKAASASAKLAESEATFRWFSGLKTSRLRSFTTFLKGLALAAPGVEAIGTGLAAIGGALAAISAPVWGTIAAVVAVVAGAGLLLWKYWDRVSSVMGGVARRVGEELQPAMQALSPILGPIVTNVKLIASAFGFVKARLGEFVGWIGGFFHREVLSDSQKQDFSNAGYEFADAMIDSIKQRFADLMDWFAGLPQRILSAIGTIDLGSVFKIPSFPWQNQPKPDGQRAMGGHVAKGQTYLTGELGRELFTPGSDGTIHNARDTQNILGGGRAGTGISVRIERVIVEQAQDARQVARELGDALRDEFSGIQADIEWSAV